VFLLFATLLAVDVVTAGGLFLRGTVPGLRAWAVAGALVLSVAALVQGLRNPVVRDYEVRLAGLPADREGTVLVEISDIHLGTLIGERWMARLVDRVNAMRPDLVVVDGDLIDGNVGEVEPLLPVLKGLRAPLGVWAVTGNHEWYAGIDRSVRLLEEAGYTVLRIAGPRPPRPRPGGRDDLTGRRQFGQVDHPVEKALGRPRAQRLLLAFATEGRGGRRRPRRPHARATPTTARSGCSATSCGSLPVARWTLRGRWDVRDRLPGSGTGPRMRSGSQASSSNHASHRRQLKPGRVAGTQRGDGQRQKETDTRGRLRSPRFSSPFPFPTF
jgi:hypothetical protein